jgi:hypothetical protein
MKRLSEFGEHIGRKYPGSVVAAMELALLASTVVSVWALVRLRDDVGTSFWPLLVGGVLTGGLIALTWHYLALVRRFNVTGWRALLSPGVALAFGMFTWLALSPRAISPEVVRVYALSGLACMLPYFAWASWVGYRVRKRHPRLAEMMYQRYRRMRFKR